MRSLSLPDNVPIAIRREFEGFLDAASLEELLKQLIERAVSVFDAVDGFVAFDNGTLHSYYQRGRQTKEGGAGADEIAGYWLESGFHKAVQGELASRFAAVSYSAFSWPFGSVGAVESPEGFKPPPRDYAILIPISSRMTVRSVLEQPFEGYAALFFNGFPDVVDRFLELIVTLPELLSGICAGFTRQSAASPVDVVSFTREMRNSLCAEKAAAKELSKGEEADEATAYDRLIEQANKMLLKLEERVPKASHKGLGIDLVEVVENTLARIPIADSRPDLDVVKGFSENLPPVSLDSSAFTTALQCVLCRVCVSARAESSVLIRTSMGEKNTAWLSISYSPSESPVSERCISELTTLHNGNPESNEHLCSGLCLSKRIFSGQSGIVRLHRTDDNDVHMTFELPFHEN